ncbi:hypothetical protein [Roseovarius ramblicola]|uniref:Flagellar FliJ protein n=1 Tax=Roseovarius ramblicola TaxID=2022336 RepID=A0ABV5HWQ2_9RHOB
MTGDGHAALCALTDALHQREAARLRALRDEEVRLRAALDRLDAQARDARALPQEALRGLREIGADIVWQGWLTRQRAALRDALARVLARREQALPAQRRAFGKAEAARALGAQARTVARDRAARRRAALLTELGAVARMRTPPGNGPDQVS